MPRTGMQTQRRQDLVAAALEVIGEAGTLDVPVKEIATRAGMSPALAFHYFGGKDGIVLETMRHLLRDYSREVGKRLAGAASPRERLEAVVGANFAPSQFDRCAAAAWLVFYLRAYSSPAAARLLSIYTARLRSNLLHPLRILLPGEQAEAAAEGLAALIDGIYIRQILRPAGPSDEEAIALCRQYIAALIAAGSAERKA